MARWKGVAEERENEGDYRLVNLGACVQPGTHIRKGARWNTVRRRGRVERLTIDRKRLLPSSCTFRMSVGRRRRRRWRGRCAWAWVNSVDVKLLLVTSATEGRVDCLFRLSVFETTDHDASFSRKTTAN